MQAEAGRLSPEKRLDGRQKIHLWYWASVFTSRYSGAVESTSARDYTDVRSWFADDNAEPGLIAEFRRSIVDLDLRRETRRGSSIYNGIFNLLILKGARDWVSGNAPQHGDLDDHHIVPKSLGDDFGLKTPIDSILNRTPLTSETNREIIRDRLPNEYLPDLIAATGEDEMLKVLQTHFISRRAFHILMRKPFTATDFESFVEERDQTIRQSISRLARHGDL